MPPAAAGLIDDANEDLAAFDLREIDDHRPQVFFVLAGRPVKDLVVVGRDDIDPRLPAAAAADKEAGVWMRHLERLAGQSPRRLIAELLVAADPVLPRLLGLLPIRGPQLGDIPLNRLTLEGLAFCLPAGQRAVFEVQVERIAVRAYRNHTWLAQRFIQRIMGRLLLAACDNAGGSRNEQKATKETKTGGEGNSAHGCGFRAGVNRWQDLPIVSSSGRLSNILKGTRQQRGHHDDSKLEKSLDGACDRSSGTAKSRRQRDG